MNELQKLVESLRARRLQRGLTQRHMADAAGIPWRTYQRLEAGSPGARIDSLLKALRTLGLQIELTPSRRPTLEQLGSIYGNEELDKPAAS